MEKFKTNLKTYLRAMVGMVEDTATDGTITAKLDLVCLAASLASFVGGAYVAIKRGNK